MTTKLNTNQLRAKATQALRDIERNPRPFAPSWEALFRDTPVGDFDWTHDAPIDWVLSQDNEAILRDNEREGGWRWIACHAIPKRTGGVETVMFFNEDSDGNWELLAEFGSEDAESDELAFELATISCHYQLLRNALYSLYVVETGDDPLSATRCSEPIKVDAKNLEREINELCSYVKSKLPETN